MAAGERKEKMKKIYVLSMLAIGLLSANCSQTEKESLEQPKIELQTSASAPFQLYPTSNMWTFIKLDTRTGMMWQVQYSVKGDDYRFETPLNATKLANDSRPGRFVLYPTQNMFNFILLDAIDGNTWQVQWSTEPDKRAIIPITQTI